MIKIHFTYFDLHTGYYPSFHHGLAYLIGTLKKEGHIVSLKHLSNENDFEEAIKFIEKEKPNLHGLSFTTNQKKYVHAFIKMSKPSTGLTIMGGVHCSLVKEKVFEDFPDIDGICIGEGEVALKELCNRLENKQDYLNPPSFYFKMGNRLVKNPIAPLQDIDGLPFPDYTLFDYQKIIEDNGELFPMLLSRGCPYDCYYCCNHALRDIYTDKDNYCRFSSVQHSIDIIKHNLSLYPKTKKIVFGDDTFTINKKWLVNFCNLYKKDINLPFICNGRFETIDEEAVQYLRGAGCVSLDFGVESGNEWLRYYILNRKYSNKKMQEVFRMASKYGIKRLSYNMVGLPFETRKMAQDTFALNLELRPDFGKCFYFYPYEGTKIYQLCLQYGLLSDNIESVSGYLESPCIKEVFMLHKVMKKYFDLLNVFFYARLILSHIKIPLPFERLLLKIVFLLKGPALFFLRLITNNKASNKDRDGIRVFACRYLR